MHPRGTRSTPSGATIGRTLFQCCAPCASPIRSWPQRAMSRYGTGWSKRRSKRKRREQAPNSFIVVGYPFLDEGRDLRPPLAAVEDAVMAHVLGGVLRVESQRGGGGDGERRLCVAGVL